jgi:DNA-binding CsgD family transcriptional regulator/pimeloyl-ACP methyl ester carboxylesterase
MNAPPVHYATTSDGYSIAYAVSGQGQPFVLMPGAFEHVQLAWQYPRLQPWLEGLAARFQLIQFDERGAGMSTRGLKEDHAQEHYQRDIEAVIGQLNPAPFVLYAGPTRVPCAVQFALNHPDKVYALILGPMSLSQSSRGLQSAFFNTLPHESWDIFLRSLAGLYQTSEDVPKAVELLKQAHEPSDFAQRQRVALERVTEASLSRLRTPTLVLHPRDYMGDSRESMKGAQLAKATMTLIDGAFALGDSEQGIRAIEAFLAGLTPRIPADRTSAPDGLSAREVEVLRLLAQGKSNAQIADELVISQNTVIRHVSNIFAKTGVANRTEAASFATRNGLT